MAYQKTPGPLYQSNRDILQEPLRSHAGHSSHTIHSRHTSHVVMLVMQVIQYSIQYFLCSSSYIIAKQEGCQGEVASLSTCIERDEGGGELMKFGVTAR